MGRDETNMSSIEDVLGHLGIGSAYALAKEGVLAFSRSVARVPGAFNINVNAIAPVRPSTS